MFWSEISVCMTHVLKCRFKLDQTSLNISKGKKIMQPLVSHQRPLSTNHAKSKNTVSVYIPKTGFSHFNIHYQYMS